MAATPSVWFDEAASAAASGAARLLIVVAQDLPMVRELSNWLQSAIPTFTQVEVERVASREFMRAIGQSDIPTKRSVLVVSDAAEGDPETLRQRWLEWNGARDRIRTYLTEVRAGSSAVFLVTRERMDEICEAAADLISVAEVLTVADEPIAVRAEDEELVNDYRLAIRELEGQYGMRTADLLKKLLAREPVAVPPPDLARWKAAAQALRELGTDAVSE
jgi:hypothetical protein